MTRAAPLARHLAGRVRTIRPPALWPHCRMRGAMASGRAACGQCGRTFGRYGGRRRACCGECAAKADMAIGLAPAVRRRECGRESAAPSRRCHCRSTACRDELAGRRNSENRRKCMADPERRAMALARPRLYGAAGRAGKGGRGAGCGRGAARR